MSEKSSPVPLVGPHPLSGFSALGLVLIIPFCEDHGCLLAILLPEAKGKELIILGKELVVGMDTMSSQYRAQWMFP